MNKLQRKNRINRKARKDVLGELDITIVEYLRPRVRIFAANFNGIPHDLMEKHDDDDVAAKAEYVEILAKIQYALDNYTQRFYRLPPEEWNKVSEGLELFGKYLPSMWV